MEPAAAKSLDVLPPFLRLGTASHKAFISDLPIRNSFIHFQRSASPQLRRCASCPYDLLEADSEDLNSREEGPTHHEWTKRDTKLDNDQTSRMFTAHKDGSCSPCVYFVRFKDGCRQGAACAFCHFCTKEDLRRYRKANYRAMKEQAWADGGSWHAHKKKKGAAQHGP
eukprot:TRINITY_DN105666_c0_g1_i1.p1 TRINITY_DN105666_c0_g1~~TRINITY_DN105666_c0_g1_i1.p1  ORF type:complete len:168 (-),score=29.63 TRINITY_DN105666_c0_g1_i1:109-612(-)